MKKNSASALETGARGLAAGLLLAVLFASPPARATNYDESKVGIYTLPDPLVLQDGRPVRDAATWSASRRPEILQLYRENIHGRSPARPAEMTFQVFDEDRRALG